MPLCIKLYHHEVPKKPLRMSSNYICKTKLCRLIKVTVLVMENNREDRHEFDVIISSYKILSANYSNLTIKKSQVI